MQILPDVNMNVIEKWEDSERSHMQNKALNGSQDFLGPARTRNSTDILCLIIFILLNFALGGLGYYVYITGNVDRLGHGSDFRGEVCGVNDLSSKKYTYFPDPQDTQIVLCIEKCPKKVVKEDVCYYDIDHVTLLKVWGCWDSIQTTEFSFFCLPKEQVYRKNVIDVFFTQQSLIKRAGGDIIYTWDIVAIGVVTSLVFAVVFIMIFPNPGMVYLDSVRRFGIYCAFFSCFLMVAFSGVVYYNSLRIDKLLCQKNNGVVPDYCYDLPTKGLQILSYISISFAVLYIVYVIWHKENFINANNLISLSKDPITKVKGILIIPVLQITLGLMIVIGLNVLILWTFSIGQVVSLDNNNVPGGKVNTLEFRSTDKIILIFVLLMCFWWLSFLIAIGDFIMGGIIGSWYFTKEKSTLFNPVSTSIKNILKYHLGTVARGSLNNLLFRFPVFILSSFNAFFLKHKTNSCSLCLAYSCCLFMWPYHKFLKYTNSASYIFLSIFAYPYSISSRQCYYLISRNHNKIDKPLKACSFVLLNIRISISLIGMLACYVYLTFSPMTLIGFNTDNLSTTLASGVFAMVACIYLAEVVCSSYFAILQALAICGMADEEMFTAEQRFMKDDMHNVFESVAIETKRIDYQVIEVQRPGRSNRVQANLVAFDENFNLKPTPSTKYRSKKDTNDLEVKDYEPTSYSQSKHK